MSDQTPDRKERSKCYASRDKFFSCLDKNGLPIPAQAEKQGVCLSENDAYLRDCMKSWSDYFSQRRVLEIRQQMTAAALGDKGVAANGLRSS